jgi:prepilin-type N-terminal cleavage/methylation domain-containing protein
MLTSVRPKRRPEEGFTLIELIISIGLLGVVFSVLALVMLASLRANQETRARLDETRDEQFVAAYFASDLAGATEMVSGTATGPAARCGTGLIVAEYLGTSFNNSSPPQQTVTLASYVFATSIVDGVLTGTLTRYACEAAPGSPYPWAPASTTVVARSLAATWPAVVCFTGGAVAACSTTTTTMTVTFGRRSGGDPFELSGARRATP